MADGYIREGETCYEPRVNPEPLPAEPKRTPVPTAEELQKRLRRCVSLAELHSAGYITSEEAIATIRAVAEGRKA